MHGRLEYVMTLVKWWWTRWVGPPTGLGSECTTYECKWYSLFYVLVGAWLLTRTLRRILCTWYVWVAPSCRCARLCPALSCRLERVVLPLSYRRPASPNGLPLCFLVPSISLMVLPVRSVMRNSLVTCSVRGRRLWTFPRNLGSAL